MPRPIPTAVTLLCVLAQLALGASALGLVVCTGRDHAAIELASDACCTGHGLAVDAPEGTTVEDTCCSDVPLFGVGRLVSDVSRRPVAPAPFLVALGLSGVPLAHRAEGCGAAVLPSPGPSPIVLRSVVLRV